jgi:hypothetical protein
MTIASASAAAAETTCGAAIHNRFGETRAYFRDVLAACRQDNYCSAVVALPDPSHQAAYAAQLRVARPHPAVDYQVEFVATTPMPAGGGAPMSLSIGADTVDLASAALNANSGNEFRVGDQGVADDIVNRLKAGRTARWTYQGENGPASATFPLRGMTAALSWIDCMGDQHMGD